MNIYEKILEVMKAVQKLQKDDTVKFCNTNYKALSEEKVTEIMRKELIKHKLVVFPIEQEWNRQGNISHIDVKYKMVNVEKPDEYITIASCGDGADTQDKGSGKAMTYAFKYMWLRTFALPTGEDPDKISSAELDYNASVKAEEDAPIDKGAITTITTMCKETGTDMNKLLNSQGVATLEELTMGQANYVVAVLMKKKATKK